MMAANNALATDNISFLDISKEIDILTTHAVSTVEISLSESPFALGVASVIVALETLHASPEANGDSKSKLDFVMKLLVDNHYFNHRDDIAQCISLFHSLQRRNRARARSMKKTEGEESDSVAATVVAALHFVSHLLLSSSFPPPFLLLSFSFFFQGPRTLRASRRINKKRKTNQSSLEDLVLSSMMALDGESSVTSIYRHIQADLPTDTLSLDDFTQLDIRDLLVKNVDAFKLNKKKTAWCLVRSKKRKSL